MTLTATEIARLRASLTAQLKNEAKRRGVAVDPVRKQYVFTLFLAQLFHVDDVPWVLLGGNALLIRTGSGRFTQDIDLAREADWVSPDGALIELTKLLAAGRGHSPFDFVLKSIHEYSEPDDGGYGTATAKVHAEALLGGVVFEHFQIDLTTRRHADAPVDRVPLTRVIDHESLDNLPSVPTIPVENHLADKICALYERHGRSGITASTRYRDFYPVPRPRRHRSHSDGYRFQRSAAKRGAEARVRSKEDVAPRSIRLTRRFVGCSLPDRSAWFR